MTTIAAKAPTNTCPLAPIFQYFILNGATIAIANAKSKAVSISKRQGKILPLETTVAPLNKVPIISK